MKFNEFIGIDISKLKFDVRIHSTQAVNVFENNSKGYLKMINWITKNSLIDKKECFFALEHTGLYSLPISVFLSENNYHFALIPGLEIKRSIGIQRGKDDVIDAKRIALYAYQKRDEIKPTNLPCKTILEIRRLLSLRDRIVRQRAGYIKDQAENKKFMKKSDNIVLFDTIDKMVKYFSKQVQIVEKELDKLIKSDNLMTCQFNLITSIKGVGKMTAMHIIVYTNCFTNFNNWREFASYSGTAPFPYSSGSSIRGRNKVSQLANKKMKTLLNMCARSAIANNPEMKIYFNKRKSEGKNGMSTINIIRNKLLSRIFAVVGRGTPYANTCNFAA